MTATDRRDDGAAARDHVLHVRSTPLARVKLEALRAVEVNVAHLTPVALMAVLDGDDVAVRDAMLRRVADAQFCVLDEGTGPRLATTVFMLRQHVYGRTFATSEFLAEVSRGMMLGQRLIGAPAGHCEFVPAWDLPRTLRSLGTPGRAAAYRPEESRVRRHARPLPYIADVTAYTGKEMRLHRDAGRRIEEVRSGRRPPRTLLTEPICDELVSRAASALHLLIKHLPAEELHLLGSAEAGEHWRNALGLITGRAPGPWHRLGDLSPADKDQMESLLWHALARDGGETTLASMPPEFAVLRDEVERQWDGTITALAERMPDELAQPLACDRWESPGLKILKKWDVIPCEDPLGPDADPNLLRPTLTTLRVARRYRSAPEVLEGAIAKWGSRPYQENRANDQVSAFVRESPPTSETEREGWVRLLRTLPKGRVRDAVWNGIEVGWPRVDLDLVEAWGREGEGDRFLMGVASSIPCFDRFGRCRDNDMRRLEAFPLLSAAVSSVYAHLPPGFDRGAGLGEGPHRADGWHGR